MALTIGMVLDIIPALQKQPTPVENDPRPQLKRSFSGLMGHSSEISEVLNLIVSAYLIFDPDGKGYIEKRGIESMIEEDGHKAAAGGNAMLSQQRWNEMVRLCAIAIEFFLVCTEHLPLLLAQDWDANGTIDFAEFVFAFTSWVDIDCDET